MSVHIRLKPSFDLGVALTPLQIRGVLSESFAVCEVEIDDIFKEGPEDNHDNRCLYPPPSDGLSARAIVKKAKLQYPLQNCKVVIQLISVDFGTSVQTVLVLHGPPLEQIIKVLSSDVEYTIKSGIKLVTGAGNTSTTIYSHEFEAKMSVVLSGLPLLETTMNLRFASGSLTGSKTYLKGEIPIYVHLPRKVQTDGKIVFNDFELILSLPKDENEVYYKDSFINPDFYSKLLTEGEDTDLTIVANNGSEFRCHRNFLKAHSNVFKAMLANKRWQTQEALTGRIQMVDMSPEGVQAFLEFIYSFKVDAPKESSKVALELFKAGHKYHIEPMEEAMKGLLLAWPWAPSPNWEEKMKEEETELALRLFTFVRNVEAHQDLKERSIDILRRNPAKLTESNDYKELFRKDTAAAMELCSVAWLGLEDLLHSRGNNNNDEIYN